jgi:hypothetical protein
VAYVKSKQKLTSSNFLSVTQKTCPNLRQICCRELSYIWTAKSRRLDIKHLIQIILFYAYWVRWVRTANTQNSGTKLDLIAWSLARVTTVSFVGTLKPIDPLYKKLKQLVFNTNQIAIHRLVGTLTHIHPSNPLV